MPATLDVARFRSAWRHVVSRHPVLRSSFSWEGVRRPLQVVQATVELSWDVQDWRTLPSEQVDAQLEAYLTRERTAGFEPDRAPLMRFALVRVSDEAWRFIWSCHHLLLDGWSRPLVLEEVAETYDALGRGSPPALESTRPYRDYIQWLMDQDLAAAEQFWRQMLTGFSAPTPIMAALPRGHYLARRAGEFDTLRRLLPLDVTERMQAAARRCQVTLSTLVHGAWALVLSRYTDSDDVVFGTTVSGRPTDLEGVERMIGPFINTLPARVRIPHAESAANWLRGLQSHLVDVRQFEYSPLAEVQRWSNVPPSAPLFESLVIFENYPSTAARGRETDAARFVEWTNYPLTFTAIPGPRLALEYYITAKSTTAPSPGY